MLERVTPMSEPSTARLVQEMKRAIASEDAQVYTRGLLATIEPLRMAQLCPAADRTRFKPQVALRSPAR
jgi:hypothetical protein